MKFNPVSTTPILITALASVWLGACSSSDQLDIGDDEVARTGLELSDYAARWDGYAEAMIFNDIASNMADGDRVRLVIDDAGGGLLRIGEAALIPDGTADSEPPQATDPVLGGVTHDLFAGVEYPISNARVETERLRFSVNPLHPWSQWCEAQPALETGDPEFPYNCVPYSPRQFGAGGGEGGCFVLAESGDRIPVSCGKVSMCLGALGCSCDATGCIGPESVFQAEVTIDAQLSGDGASLEGTMLLDDERITLRMAREGTPEE